MGVVAVHHLRDAEIEHLGHHLAERGVGQEDVLRLEVAVDNPGLVGGVDARADREHDVGDEARVEARPGRGR